MNKLHYLFIFMISSTSIIAMNFEEEYKKEFVKCRSDSEYSERRNRENTKCHTTALEILCHQGFRKACSKAAKNQYLVVTIQGQRKKSSSDFDGFSGSGVPF